MKLLSICFLLLGTGVACAQSDGKNAMASTGNVTLSESQKEDVGDIHPAGPDTFLSHVHANAQTQGEYVTNAKLLGNNSSSDFLTIPTVELRYNAPLLRGFSVDAVARSESTIYSDNGSRSFWGFSGSGFLDWRYQPKAPRLFVGIEPYFYNSFDTEHRLAEAFAISTGIDQGFVFNQHRTLFTVGYKFSNYYASPGLDDRDAHQVTVGFTHQFRPALYGQLFYQFQYSNYDNESRHDSRNIVGLNFIYEITSHLYATLGTDFIDNDSNIGLASYQNFTVHAGLALQY